MNKNGKSDWEAIYADWQKSGKTQKVYCQNKKLNYSTFKNSIYRERHMRKKINSQQLESVSPFVSVAVPELQIPYCEIRFGIGSQITIDSPEAIKELGTLIRSLKHA